jgi:hypothetical protein
MNATNEAHAREDDELRGEVRQSLVLIGAASVLIAASVVIGLAV